MSKPRVIKDYEKLDLHIQEKIKLAFPYGFEKHLIVFKNLENKLVSALPFETDDRYYLVRMTRLEAQEIIEDDEDFDDEGNLTDAAIEEISDKHLEEDND